MTNYEKIQDFNLITKFLHRTRYKNLVRLFDEVSKQIDNRPIKVIDIGCGPGKSFPILNSRYSINYVGVDLDQNFSMVAEQRYGQYENFKIINEAIEDNFFLFKDADVVLALESLEHIPELLVPDIIKSIADFKVKYFYCTVPNEIGPAILIKNIGSLLMGYNRYREYTWRETWNATLCNLDKIPLHTTAHIGFDWRWLAQTIRQSLLINEITTSPFQIIPRFLSPSIGFICAQRNVSDN